MINFFKRLKSKNETIYNKLLKISSISLYLITKKKIKGHNNKIKFDKSVVLNSRVQIIGSFNEIYIGPESFLSNCKIFIKGCHNRIFINERVKLFDCELWIEDERNSIKIGKATSINGAHIAVTENDHFIEIGENCLFSKEIDSRNGDSHSIIDLTTNKRINFAGDIVIGSHVWLGKFVKVLKGSVVGDNCVIGIGSLINSKIEKNCLAVGVPAKVIKNNVSWKHERI